MTNVRNKPTRNPHLVASDRLIACQFYDQVAHQRPLSYRPAKFATTVVQANTMTVEQMKAKGYARA